VFYAPKKVPLGDNTEEHTNSLSYSTPDEIYYRTVRGGGARIVDKLSVREEENLDQEQNGTRNKYTTGAAPFRCV
jgi:hypothetical protein